MTIPPRPWRIRKTKNNEVPWYATLEDADGKEIGRMGEEHRPTMELIVAAVNGYDPIVGIDAVDGVTPRRLSEVLGLSAHIRDPWSDSGSMASCSRLVM